jgi:hypothetical protein
VLRRAGAAWAGYDVAVSGVVPNETENRLHQIVTLPDWSRRVPAGEVVRLVAFVALEPAQFEPGALVEDPPPGDTVADVLVGEPDPQVRAGVRITRAGPLV